MSDRLAISAVFSVLAMALFATVSGEHPFWETATQLSAQGSSGAAWLPQITLPALP